MNNYGSDWTRQRVAISRIGTDFDLSTEVGTTLSMSTAAPGPAPPRLSFARHPSVIGSSLGLATQHNAKLDKPNLGATTAFQKICNDHPSKDFHSEGLPQKIDVQAILDGSTSKPFTLSDFKRFLTHIRQGRVSQEGNNWLKCAPLMLDFLFDFKSYVDGFSRLSLREQSKSPHPFEIICDLNAQSSEFVMQPSDAQAKQPSQGEELSQYAESSAKFEPQDPLELETNSGLEYQESTTAFPTNPPTLDRPNNRKVNWAPSVRSNRHRGDPPMNDTFSAVSSNLPEGSILKSARSMSSDVANTLTNVQPANQPMRGAFNTLVSKYLGTSTLQSQPDGLLSACNEISSETIQRAILEGKLTNHPAVLTGIALEILSGLNKHVLPAFMSYSIQSQKEQIRSRSENLCGLMLFFIAFILSLLMIIVPSPLMTPWKIRRPIPKAYRLVLFPLLWVALLLILKNRCNMFCVACWRNNFRSTECGWKLDGQGLRKSPHSRDGVNALTGNEKTNLETQQPTDTNWLFHQLLTRFFASLLLAAVVQILFMLLPFLS